MAPWAQAADFVSVGPDMTRSSAERRQQPSPRPVTICNATSQQIGPRPGTAMNVESVENGPLFQA